MECCRQLYSVAYHFARGADIQRVVQTAGRVYEKLWYGRVPQLPQLDKWIDAWAESSSTLAFGKQEKIAVKKTQTKQ